MVQDIFNLFINKLKNHHNLMMFYKIIYNRKNTSHLELFAPESAEKPYFTRVSEGSTYLELLEPELELLEPRKKERR